MMPFTPLKRDKERPSSASKIGIAASACQELVFQGEAAKDRESAIFAYEEALREKIRTLGYCPHLASGSINPPIDGSEWSNTAEERARHFINLLNNPEIEAIMQVTGGEGTLEVVALLDAYDKDWPTAQQRIEKAWYKTHPNSPLPENFWHPRLPDSHYCDADGNTHGLPRRELPHIGYSDISVLNNFLGQRNIARPYYANMLSHDIGELESCGAMLSNAENVTTYDKLQPLNAANINSTEPLAILATVPEWIAGTAETAFPFHVNSPTLLAIESIEDLDHVAQSLQAAKKRGMLSNVKGIVMGGIKGGNPPALQAAQQNQTLQNLGIPILISQSQDSFGHRKNGITKPFANGAMVTLEKDAAGTYQMSIIGHAKTNKMPAPQHRPAPKESPTIAEIYGQIAHEYSVKPGASNDKIIMDWRCLADLNAIDLAGKSVTITSGREKGLHSALVASQLSGKLTYAHDVTVALPEPKPDELNNPASRSNALLAKIQDAKQRYFGETPLTIIQDNKLSTIKEPLKIDGHCLTGQSCLKTASIAASHGVASIGR